MSEREPNVVDSGLSRKVTRDGVTVKVSIVRLEHEKEWSLEVVNAANTSIVWDDLFPTDEAAYAEFEQAFAEGVCERFETKRRWPRFLAEDANRIYCGNFLAESP